MTRSPLARPALRRLRSALDADLAAAGELAAVRERREEIDELTDDLDRQLERLREAAVITLVGATGAGKSTLLNALVGAAVASEGETRPTTDRPVVYRPVDADLGPLLAGLPGEPPVVVDYDPSAGGPWSEQVLIDAPDVNSVAAEHRDVVRELARRSDALVVVAHRQSVKELATVEFVDAFSRRRGMLFVLNRSDELTPESRERILAELRELAAERWGAPEAPVIATSALRARAEAGPPGWAELCAALRALVADGDLGSVRRHNAIGTAGQIATLFREIEGGTDEELAALEAEAGSGLSSLAGELEEEIGTRLELREAHLFELFLGECARRWDGPGGWALRAGGLGALGLGTGALLVRRNPLLAAGAAAGSLVAGRARDALSKRRLADPSGLVPGPVELDQTFKASLGAARLSAARVAGSPTAFGLPEPEELGEAAGAAAGEAWQRVLERDLSESASSAAPWPMRLAADLPVYALLAWVVWRAGEGFFTGSYVGLDFLLNALVVLAAWCLLLRFLLRRIFLRRSRRLVRRARELAAANLSSTWAEIGERVRRQIGATRAALKRLAGLEEAWREGVGT